MYAPKRINLITSNQSLVIFHRPFVKMDSMIINTNIPMMEIGILINLMISSISFLLNRTVIRNKNGKINIANSNFGNPGIISNGGSNNAPKSTSTNKPLAIRSTCVFDLIICSICHKSSSIQDVEIGIVRLVCVCPQLLLQDSPLKSKSHRIHHLRN